MTEAETILNILDGGGWELHRIPPSEAFTKKANKEHAWGIKRTEPPFCDKNGDRQWTGPTALKVFKRAFKALDMDMLKFRSTKTYVDSTPELRVRDSSFEDWFSNYEQGRNPHKELARAAYAAGMGDPLVMANPKMQFLLWTNTTVPMPEDEPEVAIELEQGDIVRWKNDPENYETIRLSGVIGL